jgi:uncharacterized membrane protein
MSKKYQIRYNTLSTGERDRWRLIENGNEILVSDIKIEGHVETSKDWIEDNSGSNPIGTWKWHITCKGKAKIVDGVAYIKAEKNLIATHLAKTGNFKVGMTIGGLEVITKMILYFIHERVWHKYR